MIKFSSTSNAQSQINKIAATIRKASTLEGFSQSPELPAISGRCVQRTIDAQKFKPLSPKYRVARDRKFGKRPILRLTDSLYKRAVLPGFARVDTGNGFRTVQIRITDLIGGYQQGLGRDLFKPDQQLREEIYLLAAKTIAADINKNLVKN